jgi:hypothetical protein
MNGRIYDPELGRFLSADPYVQSPLNSQSHNRYSYVLNNPLRYIDPSGYYTSSCDGGYDSSGECIGSSDTSGGYGGTNSSYGSDHHSSSGSSSSVGGDTNIYGGDVPNGVENVNDDSSNHNMPETQTLNSGDTHSDDSMITIVIGGYSEPGINSYTSNWFGYGGGTGSAGSDWSGMAHTALDAIGWIPGLGSVASVIDSVIYVYQGDWTNAGFAIAGVLGPGGKALGRLGKVAKGLKGNKDFKAALGQFKNTKFTNAGRAVTKHPEYFGFKNTEALRKVYNTESKINKLAADTLKDIMRTGKTTTGAGGRYPNGWKTITAPDGRAASWHTDGRFIGFRGVQ